MTRSALSCLIALLVLASLACLPAQATPADSAPWLGDATYSIHASGPLGQVVGKLSQAVGRPIELSGHRDASGNWVQDKADTQVKLDADKATLSTILLSLCEQAGLVFSAPAGGEVEAGPVTLRPGNPKLDPRPTGVAGSYLVRVTRVGVEMDRAESFLWGEAKPAPPNVTDRLGLILEIVAKTPEAALALAGLSKRCVATLDKGGSVESKPGSASDFALAAGRGGGAPGRTAMASLSLPAPKDATVIRRLQGDLLLFSAVKTTEISVPPDSQGKILKQDDVSVTVKTWQVAGKTLTVDVQSVCPPLGGGNGQRSLAGRQWQRAVLVDKLGAQSKPTASSSQTFGDRATLQYQFQVADPAQIGAVKLTFQRTGAASKTLPFTIENIPLP